MQKAVVLLMIIFFSTSISTAQSVEKRIETKANEFLAKYKDATPNLKFSKIINVDTIYMIPFLDNILEEAVIGRNGIQDSIQLKLDALAEISESKKVSLKEEIARFRVIDSVISSSENKLIKIISNTHSDALLCLDIIFEGRDNTLNTREEFSRYHMILDKDFNITTYDAIIMPMLE